MDLDLLPRDRRLLGLEHVGSRQRCCANVGHVLSEHEQGVEVVRVNDRRDATTAAGEVHR